MATRMLNFNNLTSSIGASLPNPLRSKKKYHFEVTLTLQELENCTFVSGVLFAKLQLKDGGTFNGSSHRNDVEHHGVQWDEDFNFTCKMYANASTMILEPCYCKISIRKETKGGKSYTKLGYIRINLAEFAGQGTKQRKYLLQSYNESKHKPDNSLLKVKLYLRQTSGDIVFKPAETQLQSWETGGEADDEGFQDDWRSIYSRGTPRASNGSTLSSFSSVTGGTWSSHSGSAGNLKSHDDSCEDSKEVSAEEEDHESGSEETVIEQSSSQITMDTVKTGSSNNTGSSSWKTAETVSSSGKTNLRITTESTSCSPRASPSRTISSSGGQKMVSPILSNRSQSTGNIETPSNLKLTSGLSPSAPMIIEESTPHTDPSSPHDPSRRHTDSFRFSKSENNNELLKVPPPSQQKVTGGGISPMARKGGPSVQTSQVTAVGGSSKYHHHRQSSMGGGFHQTPSPLTYGRHKRHNSMSTSIPDYSDTQSVYSAKTRVSTLSTIEQSRADNNLVIAGLIASHDLTPASDDDSETNLKLYIDKHGGGVTITGHDLSDKHRFKEIDVTSMSSDEIHRKSRKGGSSTRSSIKSSSNSSQTTPDSPLSVSPSLTNMKPKKYSQ